MHTLIVIVGPTGVGKTETCIEIARHFNSSIINADSRQIYKEIPIGTAAPTKEQMSTVKHHLVGCKNLYEYYSAAMFESDAIKVISSESKYTNVSILSGGSMMYIDAVCKGIDDIPTVNDDVRNTMRQRLYDEGLPCLVEELKKLDPEYWNIVDRNNPRRVVHALEIIHQTGQSYSSFRSNIHKKRPFDIVKIGLNMYRGTLYNRINQRVCDMMDNGMLGEAKSVYKYKGVNSLNTVGYKELFEYIEHKISLDEAITKIQSNTREYARKQLTWFKKDISTCWFYPDDKDNIINYINNKRKINTTP